MRVVLVMDTHNVISFIVRSAIIAAIYVALTFITYPIAFSNIQFRCSELLVLLCFFNRGYCIGITLGCFLTNIASPFMPLDLLIGTAATLISCIAVSFFRHLGLAILVPIVANSFLVGIEYYLYLQMPYMLGVGLIAIGETSVLLISYFIFMFMAKKEAFQIFISAKQNKDFKW